MDNKFGLDQALLDAAREVISESSKIDEVSAEMLGRYSDKANKEYNDKKSTPETKAKRKSGLINAYLKVKARSGVPATYKEETELEDFTLEEIDEFLQTEEYEQLDELSKATLGSYIKKASRDSRTSDSLSTEFGIDAKVKDKKVYQDARQSVSDKLKAKANKRQSGVNLAVDKLTKEETEAIEALATQLGLTKE